MATASDHVPKTPPPSKLFSICEIRPYLYIAGYGALSHKKLKELGITHAVNATNILKTLQTPGIEYLDVKLDDDEAANIQLHFEEVAEFVQTAKNNGGKALIYCAAGISRSASLSMMTLVINEGLTLRNAFIEVGRARPIIAPNLGFWRQMIAYEQAHNGGESTVVLLKGGMRKSIPDVYLNKTALLNGTAS
uniref:Dual specificity protein phosphatase 14 n=1 Tax=Panagrellus redivivus TaxID=6233 RepID=A0A7E4UXH6_PANRE